MGEKGVNDRVQRGERRSRWFRHDKASHKRRRVAGLHDKTASAAGEGVVEGSLKMMCFFRRSAIAALSIWIGLSLSSAPPASGASASIGGATIDGTTWSADRALAVPGVIGEIGRAHV